MAVLLMHKPACFAGPVLWRWLPASQSLSIRLASLTAIKCTQDPWRTRRAKSKCVFPSYCIWQLLRTGGRQPALLGTCATFTLVPAAQVVEVDAFCSVQDMIQAAIASYGAQASLREVRYFCHAVSYAARFDCGSLCKVNLYACCG